jgi:hypothetical protein
LRSIGCERSLVDGLSSLVEDRKGRLMERMSDYSHKVIGNSITNSSREGADRIMVYEN